MLGDNKLEGHKGGFGMEDSGDRARELARELQEFTDSGGVSRAVLVQRLAQRIDVSPRLAEYLLDLERTVMELERRISKLEP
jgi:hypothetical protein